MNIIFLSRESTILEHIVCISFIWVLFFSSRPKFQSDLYISMKKFMKI